MCACEPTFVCSRCAGTPGDWRYHLEDGPETPEQQRERQVQEHNVSVVLPILERG